MSELLSAQFDAEKRLLSAMLIAKDFEADKLQEPLTVVGAGDFADKDCAELYQAILDLHERGEPINETSLYRAIEGRLSEESRYFALMTDLLDLEPHESHMMFHASQVKELATRRRLIVRLQNTVCELGDLSRDIADVDLDLGGYSALLKSSSHGEMHMKNLQVVTAKITEWIWEPYIPLGTLTHVAGNPGVGKTWSVIDFASRVAMGRYWPDRSPACAAGDVVFLTAEDGEDTLAWRFDQLGCDRSKIHIMDRGVSEIVKGKRQDRFLDLGRDLHHLEAFLEQRPNVKLMILDTANDFMGDANPNSNNEVRAVYGPVARMAKRRNIAVILINHFNKDTKNGQAIFRNMGSLAFVALSRVVWGFFKDPEEAGRVIFAPIKNNLAPMPGAMAFSLTDGKPVWEPDAFEVDADALMQPPKPHAGKAGEKAEAWLRDQLKDGPVAASDLEANLPGGFCWKTADRVSRNIGVHKQRIGLQGDPKWMWSLNGSP